MKNLFLLFFLMVSSLTLVSQTDTSYFYYSAGDSMFYLVQETFFEDVTVPPVRNVESVGKDSASVISLMVGHITQRTNKAARGVRHTYENKGLTPLASLLQLFSGENYYKHSARRFGTAMTGDYKVWVDGVSMDASMAVNGAGNMKLTVKDGVPTVYSVNILGKNSFIVRNYTPEHVTYFLVREDNERKLFLDKNDTVSYRIIKK